MSERKGTKGLELWCRKMTEGYPGVKVENMTTSWRDGLAFCAIIHYFRPDLIEFDKLNKEDIYGNNELAFRIAEEKLGIPALLEPEDMVEFEVPDRLSILTYLSQFYQTFENQRGKSAARIAPKRPQSSPDHGIVSPASTSPPSKVQITLGKARKQPCAKCGFPVFIAERLNVGKLLYHRTCFRCARCNSQLTLANYYETENDEFCCEICPDEEKQISKKVSPEIVLSRSMSDEEKTASLRTYAEETSDAYSTNFETALEFPLDGELKKSFTLTGAESTEFSKARSHFFQSQMESSSESGSDDIQVELPKSTPPPLIKSQFKGEDIPFDNSDSKPPLLAKPDYLRIKNSDKKDTDKVSDSISTEQTDDHFVTKDNAFSSNRVSVRARMKLFENNEDNNNKSDINRFSSRCNSVPFRSDKKATVVAIDDLEDFDNISRNNSSINVHRDNVQNVENVTVDDKTEFDNTTRDSNVDLSKSKTNNNNNNNLYKLKDDVDDSPEITNEEQHNNDIKILDSNQEAITCDSSQEDSKLIETIEILDSSQEQEIIVNKKLNQEADISFKIEIEDDVIDILNSSAESETKKESILTIEDSPEVNDPKLPLTTNSEDSFLTAKSMESPRSLSSDERPTYRRGYYTAYEYLEQNDVRSEPFEQSFEATRDSKDTFNKNDNDNNKSAIYNEYPKKHDNVNETTEQSYEGSTDITADTFYEKKDNNLSLIQKDIIEPPDINVCKQDLVASDDNKEVVSHDDITINNQISKSHDTQAQISAQDSKIPDNEYPDDLNPFEEDDNSASAPPSSFGAVENEKIKISTNQHIPAPRTKKKIAPTLEESILSTPDTPGFYKVCHRLSINLLADDDDDCNEGASYNPFEDDACKEEQEIIRKKKIMPSIEERKDVKSYNPFDEDEDEDLEPVVRPVPIPTPRISKVSRPEPKPRDALSITSKGSHGGSNSSISSGSAVGSARKKKPAPRPPMPFQNNDPSSIPGSSLASPNQSLTQSPNLSGTMRSRKTKRAPLPPSASTPHNVDGTDFINRASFVGSPINLEQIEGVSNSDTMQKEKDVKDEVNRNRQSQIQNDADSNLAADKSTAGRWKRRKGQAPSRPIPERRIVKTLPLSEIKRELDTIEIQQQGLEKQGIRLEQIIREKCEGSNGQLHSDDQVPIEVEDLILQLFELVNEKNELFRRQAELMYLRRQQRLEEEHADVEYQIRCLILQPEANKSDYDKVREETLLKRLVEIVERRNEIIDCLEMDRRREAEEDNSIRSQLNLYSSKRDDEKDSHSKKDEKKDKKKKHKKLNKIIHTFKHKKEKDHKVDVDKDVDETEVSEKGKKKKFNIF